MLKKLIGLFSNLFKSFVGIGLIGFGLITYIYWHVKPTLPKDDFLNSYRAPELTRIYDKNFQLVAEWAPVNRVNVRFSDIPEKVIAAFLVAEDKNFYYHSGIDPIRITRAILQNVTQSSRSLIGASTITQQVAKNFLIGNEKSMLRKFREAFATISIENKLSKDHILELYLNQIYFGSGAYGIQSAALKYFNKSIEKLSIAEAALLASLPKAPASLSISKNIKKLKNRRNSIINALYEQGYISDDEANKALSEEIEVKNKAIDFSNHNYYLLPLKEAILESQPNLNFTSGIEIFSCIDAKFQESAQNALREGLLKYDLKHKKYTKPIAMLGNNYVTAELKQINVVDCPQTFQKAVVDFNDKNPTAILEDGQIFPLDIKGWSFEKPLSTGDVVFVKIKHKIAELRQIPEISGGIVVMEAKTGNVLALVGGWSSGTSQFNCATQAMRQPGSCFKTFVYLSALEQGITPNDIIDDSPIVMYLNGGKEIYKPKNVNGKFHGSVTVKNSLANSYNLASLYLAKIIGIENIQDTADLLGIYHNTPKNPAVILGASETTLLKLTTAYAMIFNGGYYIKPQFFKAYTQRQTAYINKNTVPCGVEGQKNLNMVSLSTVKDMQRVATPQAISGMLEMLRLVITEGTGKSLLELEKKLGVKFKGKTGTTNNNMDAWFVGSVSVPGTIYQDDNPLVIGIFVGFLQPKNLENGGAAIAMPIFGNFIKNILSDTLIKVDNF